jgi:hypothetical protein
MRYFAAKFIYQETYEPSYVAAPLLPPEANLHIPAFSEAAYGATDELVDAALRVDAAVDKLLRRRDPSGLFSRFENALESFRHESLYAKGTVCSDTTVVAAYLLDGVMEELGPDLARPTGPDTVPGIA